MTEEELEGRCPCQDCNKRYATCHGECKDYLDWNKKHVEFARRAKRRRNEGRPYRDLNGYRKW